VALDRQRIVAEAVALLDEGGLDGVTLRRLAARLGVQAPTLYWHLRNKEALINAIAEEILAAEFGTLEPAGDEPWQIWLAGLATRLRRAMLAHPDGARVVSAGQLSVTMADVSELAMRTLVEQGVPLRRARLTVLAVERFTIGHVLEEQAPRPDAASLEGFDMAAFSAAHPTVIAGITDYFQDGRDVDTLFRDTLRILLG
jgi:TetR/AcrR family tetracycline transcriptional repressor